VSRALMQLQREGRTEARAQWSVGTACPSATTLKTSSRPPTEALEKPSSSQFLGACEHDRDVG
jgi:hypothetical protein